MQERKFNAQKEKRMTTNYNITINAYSGSIVNICGGCCSLTGSCFVTCSMESTGSGESSLQDLGLIVDIDPMATGTLSLNGNQINVIASHIVNPTFALTGTGHAPLLNTSSWGNGISTMQFIDGDPSQGSYADVAGYYLVGNSNILNALNATTSSYTDATIICALKMTTTTSLGQVIWTLMNTSTYAEIYNYGIDLGFDDRFLFGSKTDAGADPNVLLNDLNTTKFISAIIFDGTGSMDFYVNGSLVTASIPNVNPKTINRLIMGAKYIQPAYGDYYTQQFDGHIARYMIFNRKLLTSELSFVHNMLSSSYMS